MGVPARSGGGAKKTCPRAGSLAHARSLAWIEFAMPLCPSDAPHWTARNAERAARCDRPQLRRRWRIAMTMCDRAGLGGRRHRASHRSTLAEPPPHEWRLRQFVVVQNHFPLLPRSVWRAPGVSRPALRARQRRADASPRAQGSPFLCALSLRVAAKSLMTRWRARRPVQERLVPSGARLGRGDRSAHESAGETDRPDKAMVPR